MSEWILRLGEFDERLLHALAHRRRRAFTLFMRAVTHLGDAPVAIATAGLMLVGGVPGFEGAGLLASGALILSHLLSQLLKRRISRPRPQLPVGLRSIIEPPDRFSFPSGHASATLAVALPIAMAAPPAMGAGFIGVAVLIGVSRCYLGVHYPGDVVAGWGLALLSVATAGLLLR